MSADPNVTSAIAHIQAAQQQLDLALADLNAAPGPEPEPPLYANAIQDRDPRDKPALPVIGPAGSTFVDPVFGTTILRVTDATMDGSSWRVASNVHVATWSADVSRFYLMGPTGKRVFNRDGTVVTDISSQCEPTWSRSVADGIWGVGGPVTRTIQFSRINPAGQVNVKDVLDLDHLGLPDLVEPRTYVGGMVSADSAVAVFFGGQGQDDHHYAAVLLEGESQFAYLIDTLTEPGLGFRLHSISIDHSGRYVVLYPVQAKPAHMFIWDVEAGTYTPVVNAPWGHDTQGYGWEINHDVAPDGSEWDGAQWVIRKLNELDVAENLIEPVLRPKETYFDDHSSWHNARPEKLLPVFTATYRYNDEQAPWRAWDDEIIAIATDGPSTVYRFAHHRADVRDEGNPAGTYFWYQPLASVSPDGKFVLFSSNWEKSLGDDPNDPGRSRQDVFLVTLP